ncbi:hypothetical protein [Cytophaga aurantiaca]|uniref:hypothetical protein n=1 Tax=Cytophaga aurantiaca TaxID=29530 RepID=UPI0012F8E4CD|nr:hypothetical protein [Cytophaga aurantiaca]
MNVFYFLLSICMVEAALGFFYYLITPKSMRVIGKVDYKSLAKGSLERMFLMISLINGYPHALTLFGTLKLATRLKRDSEGDKKKESLYNDFYLLGNFVSIICSFFYVYLYDMLIIATIK